MHKLNLLPKDIQISQNKRKLGLFYVITGSLLLIFIIFVMVNLNYSIKLLENEIYLILKDISEMKPQIINNFEQKILEDFERRQSFYNISVSNNIPRYSAILDDVIYLVPTEIAISSISLDDSNDIKIKGYTTGHKYIAMFMEELNTIDNILDVSLGFSRLMDTKEEDGIEKNYEFEIIIQFRSGS